MACHQYSLQKTIRHSFTAGILLLSTLVSTARGQDNFATFPPLPSGYTSIKVFDNQRRFVGRILPEKRYWVSIDRIPAVSAKGGGGR